MTETHLHHVDLFCETLSKCQTCVRAGPGSAAVISVRIVSFLLKVTATAPLTSQSLKYHKTDLNDKQRPTLTTTISTRSQQVQGSSSGLHLVSLWFCLALFHLEFCGSDLESLILALFLKPALIQSLG